MYKLRQIWFTAISNFRRWRRSPQVILAFCLAFVVCFLLSDKVVTFAKAHDTLIQAAEPFIWTFGDAKSVLIISLTLLLLFADMPHLGNEVPLFLARIDRKIWMLGQILYLVMATFIFLIFILVSTIILSESMVYPANLWSDTAAVLGYSDIGNHISVPSFVKVMERALPYTVMLHIFGLMLGYSLVLAGIILLFNMIKDNGGMIAGIIFSGLGFLLTPDTISDWFNISSDNLRYANIIFGWISPLNHATYYMHSFGYDNLPKLWNSYIFFAILTVVVFALSMLTIKRYTFNFTGTEKR